MPANMPCPNCGGPVPVDAQMVGLYVQCSRCGVQFEVPAKFAPWVRSGVAQPPSAGASSADSHPGAGVPHQHDKQQPQARVHPEGSPRGAPVPHQPQMQKAEAEWDLPDAFAPEPANVGPVDARTNRPVVRKLWLAGAAALVILCVVVAMNWSKRPSVGEPPAEMWAMGRDVDAAPWRVRVDGIDWREDPANPRNSLLEVRLTLTNASAEERPAPSMYLGSPRLKSLSAEFGQPVLKTAAGEGVFRVAPSATVSGTLLFAAPRGEFCLLVVAGAQPVPIALTVSNPRLKE